MGRRRRKTGGKTNLPIAARPGSRLVFFSDIRRFSTRHPNQSPPWTFPLRCGASLGDRHLLQTVPAPLQSKVAYGFVRTTGGRATWSMQPNPYVVSHNNTLTSEVRLYIHTPERLVKVRSAMSLYVASLSYYGPRAVY